jgi:hypothetical protein
MTEIMVNGEFTPGKYNTGEKYVISLTLPEGVTKLKTGGASGDSTFQYFVNLEEISGPKVERIGAEMFYAKCVNLRTVSFPVAKIIVGSSAFGGCKALSSVYLPMIEAIGNVSFANTGPGPLTITLGATAPSLDGGNGVFWNSQKNVTVRVPSGATGYDTAWQNTFKKGASFTGFRFETY